jgi:integrase
MSKRKHLYRKPGYVYFRNPKTSKLTPLPLDETSSEFADQYSALFAALTAKPRDPNVRVKRNCDDGNLLYAPATLGWFVKEYLASDKFKAYSEGTRYNYRKALDLLKARLGGGLLADLDPEAVEVYSAEVAREHGPAAGDNQISMISNLWEFAKGFREFKRKGRFNPTIRMKRHYEHDGEGHLAWPEDVIETFDQDCPAHLQFTRLGLHYTGQRGGDVAAMRWEDFDGTRIHVVQEKTGKKLWLNCPKPLLAALKREQRNTNREFIFVHAYGEPWANAQTLSHAIRNRLEALGINDKAEKGYTMHGLRKNAGMELAEAGCTVEEIMAVLGHKTPRMALFYCEQARQKVMNESAVDKWDAAIEKIAAKKLAKNRSMLRVVSTRLGNSAGVARKGGGK